MIWSLKWQEGTRVHDGRTSESDAGNFELGVFQMLASLLPPFGKITHTLGEHPKRSSSKGEPQLRRQPSGP